jgi:ABC-2 type transport system permease protein
MKDIRTFLRDPVQWSQALIFFGLLALYFSNLRTFRYHTFAENWRNTIAFLNVFSVSAVICSLGSRFIYPQLSLEGQGFWILGLSPAKMSRILLTKFFLALICMMTVSVGLMLLSARMLNASPVIVLVAVLLACAISSAVCGLSTGLGAVYLDLNQRNPAAIVSGFGGTLNLVLSLGFMLSIIMPFGLIFHSKLLNRIDNNQMFYNPILAGLWMTGLTITTITVPLYLGIKKLTSSEY